MRRLLAIFGMASLLAGCGGKSLSENQKINGWLAATDVAVPPARYVVQPPDVLLIQSPRVSELNNREATVRPDGKVTFNLIGEVDVAGLTTDQISQELVRRMAKYYQRDALDIAVVVTGFKSKFIYVFGQVESQGVKPYTGRDSLLKVIAEARLNEDAWPERVVVVRPNDDPNVKQKVTLDVKKMFEAGNVEDNILLEEGDCVYVPPTPLANFTAGFNKLLFPLRPATTLVGLAAGGI